jgi:hypothetical protein
MFLLIRARSSPYKTSCSTSVKPNLSCSSKIDKGKKLTLGGTTKCRFSFPFNWFQYLINVIILLPRALILLQTPPLNMSLFLSFQMTQRMAPLTISQILSFLYEINAFICHKSSIVSQLKENLLYLAIHAHKQDAIE